jgi:amidophosphoribosyltransferase
MQNAVRAVNPRLTSFEASCFDGKYITGDITPDYLSYLAAHRDEKRDTEDLLEEAQLEVASGEPSE